MSTPNLVLPLGTTAAQYTLALKQFWGQVFTSFREKTPFWDNSPRIIATKNIDSGNTHQFIEFGEDVDAEYVDDGDEQLGQQSEFDEGTITLDRILSAHRTLGLTQINISHFDAIQALGQSIGRGLAQKLNRQLVYVGLNAARTAAKTKNGLTIHNGGNRVEAGTNGDIETAFPATSTGAEDFRESAGYLAQLMDEDHVPEEDRYLFIPPYIRRVLGQNTAIFDKDFDLNPQNSMNQRVIGVLEGFKVVVITQMPSTNITTGEKAVYTGDFRYNGASGRPAALALCGAMDGKAAIGMVRRMGIVPTMKFQDEKNTWFFRSQLMVGAGVLNPYCAGEIFCNNS